jgi:ceramide glucosyltransferase
MDWTLRNVGVAVSALGTLASIGFFVLSGCGALSFLKGRRQQSGRGKSNDWQPGVTILKPLKGTDPYIWENFCSHCEQDYPEYQLVFGVSEPDDGAIGAVQRLKERYPDLQIDLVVCERKLGTNTKVSNLVQMLAGARHPILLVNDSDIRVPRHYLRKVVARLNDDRVGLVTCLYRGIASKTLGSRLEALGIVTDFVPGVLSARLLENGLRFGLGSTLAFRRSDLEAVGGFEGFLDYLADDYELGRRIAALGKRVELSEVVVDTFLPAYSMRGFIEHQIRWSRTIRDVRRWGYLGVSLTFGLAWGMLTLALTHGAGWAWLLVAITAAARAVVAIMCARAVLHDETSLHDLYLLPARDLIAPLLWALSFAGNRISWRGDLFYLKQGRLSRVPREAAGN